MMRVTVALEARFDATSDGRIWTTSTFDREFWDAYLAVFDGVRVVARVRDVARVEGNARLSSGRGVTFEPIPYYVGAAQYARSALSVERAVRRVASDPGAFILRVPSPIGGRLTSALGRRPYGLEVVGDPSDVFAPGAVRHPLRPAMRWWFSRELRSQAARAAAASYVTEGALQRKYPCPRFMTGISSIRLGPEAFATGARAFAAGPIRLIQVGTLEELYKAPDVTLEAVAQLVERGFDVTLSFVGDGRRRRQLEASSAARRLGGRVTFVGALQAGDAVRAALDGADLFVLPSRQEGLPRAMIEAMARGLPAIGSTVGGIPELLQPSELVPPGDAHALRRTMEQMIADPARMTEASARNLAVARRYAATELTPRRTTFYERVRAATQAHGEAT